MELAGERIRESTMEQWEDTDTDTENTKLILLHRERKKES